MSTEVAVATDLGQEKVELIKQTVAKGATDLELELFLHACKRTGLDPLMKQIYAIKRTDRASGKQVMAIQTGIDGYRLIADRTGQYAGSDEPTYVIAEDGWPDMASVTIYKMVGGVRCPFSASARWKEYCQESSPMWKKMPFLMLGKCAEALALRKAFPAELSGVYTHEEMMQADQELPAQPHPVLANKQTAQAKIAELAKEMQEPARQEARKPASGTSATGTDESMPEQQQDSAAPYTFKFGQCKGKSICTAADSQLSWYMQYYTNKIHTDPNSQYMSEWEEACLAIEQENQRRADDPTR